MIPSAMRKVYLVVPLVFVSALVLAQAPPSKILYVGAVSINPCQDAKVLADWYARFGIDTKEYHGRLLRQTRHRRRPVCVRHPSQKSECSGEMYGECFSRLSRGQLRSKLGGGEE